MRRIVTAISAAALALSFVAQAIPAYAVTPGYDSSFRGESAFLFLDPGETGTFFVFFANTGTTTWTRDTSTQVNLAACLEDKVTCPAQDADEATFNSGWLSTTTYATHSQTSVAPGALATFTYNVAAPATAAAAVYRFNGDLVVAATGDRIHPEGYYQDVEVPVTSASGITVEPASDTNQTNSTHTVTITVRDSAGNAQANVPVDVFVVNNATWTGACSSGQLDSTASPSASGTSCTIDAGDFATNSSGQITFAFSNSAIKTNRIVAWTGTVGSTYTADARQGSATKTWIGAVAATNVSPGTDVNPFASGHTLTAALQDAAGDPVALSGETIRFTVYRNTTTFGSNTSNSNTCTSGTVVSSNVAQTDANGSASFTYTGPADPTSSAGDSRFDCIFAFWDRNNDGIVGTTDFSESVTKQWSDGAAAASTLTLSPRLDGNPASSTHVVTATLRDQFGNGVSGATIRFTISRTSASGTAASEGTTTAARTTGTDGTAQFGYVGTAYSSIDDIDACYDADTTTTTCDGTNFIAFTTVDNATKNWAIEASAATFTAYTVRYCDAAGDTVYAQNGTAAMFRFIYDSGDQFTVDTTPTTMAAFETACTPKTITQASDTITITYNPGGVSSFDLTNN